MVEIAHLGAVVLAFGAAFSSACQSLSVRIGTEQARAYDAFLVAMLVTNAILLPSVGLYYYPDYGLTPASWLWFIAAGIVGTLLGILLMYMSIERIGASRTAPVVASNAIIATILGVLLLDESLAFMHGIGIVCIVVGVSVIAWETSQDNPHELSRRELLMSLLLPVGAAVAFGAEPVLANFGFAEGTPAPVGLTIKTVTATVGFVLYLRWRNALPDPTLVRTNSMRWLVLAGLGNLGFLIGYYVGIEIAPVSVVVPILITTTLFVLLLSALFMPRRLERVTWRLATSAGLVVLGALIVTIYG